MPVRVMSTGIPTTRFEDQNSPVLDGIGRAAQSLLELGPKLGQIKLEKARLALDQQREDRAQHSSDVEEGRQAVSDYRAQIEAAPGNFHNTPSPYDNALAEQTETANAAKGLPPAGYQEGLPRTPQKSVPLSGFAAALDDHSSQNPFIIPQEQEALYDKLGRINSQNEQSHMPTQSRPGQTYENYVRMKTMPSHIQQEKLDNNQAYRASMLPIKQQMADAASDRADAVGENSGDKHALLAATAARRELQQIHSRYAPPKSFDLRSDQEKAQSAVDYARDLQEAKAFWAQQGVDAPQAAPQSTPVNSEGAMLQKLLELQNASKAKP